MVNKAVSLLIAFILVFILGWTKGQASMQARLDAAQVAAQNSAADVSLRIAASEQKARSEFQQYEDAFNALPDTAPALCIPDGWVR